MEYEPYFNLEMLIEAMNIALNDKEVWKEQEIRRQLAHKILDLQYYYKRLTGDFYTITDHR